MVKKVVYNIGARLRNPSLLRYQKFLKTSDYWSERELVGYQVTKCKELLIFAATYCDFYKELFDKIGFDPNKFVELEQLKKIPIISKEILIAENGRIHSKYIFNKLLLTETSGSTGKALVFKKNEEWDSHNRAALFRGYSWYGINPWDRNGYFWGYNTSPRTKYKIMLLDILQNRFRVFSYNEEQIRAFTKKLQKAKYLHGYSSMIYEVAKIVNELGLNNTLRLKMVSGTSEKIYDSYHSESENAFGQKIVSEYGSTESGLIAFECPYGSMHINMENVIVEVENNEIIVTNLLSKSFPIIRYKLGDYVQMADKDIKCECGRAHYIIKEVIGRIGVKVRGKREIYPSLTFYYVFKNIALNNNISLSYQAVQREVGKIEIKIEQNMPDVEVLIRDELLKYFKDDIEFSISYGQKLNNGTEKVKDFISLL